MNGKDDILDDLSALSDGALDPDRRREVEAALESDPELRAECERLRATVAVQAVALHLHQGKSRWDSLTAGPVPSLRQQGKHGCHLEEDVRVSPAVGVFRPPRHRRRGSVGRAAKTPCRLPAVAVLNW